MSILKFNQWTSTNEEVRETEQFCFFTACFDIWPAWKMIQENPDKYKSEEGKFHSVELESLKRWWSPDDQYEDLGNGRTRIKMGVRVNAKHAKSLTDEELDQPGIYVHQGEDFSMLIDGWHRAYGRYLRGDKEMDIWVFSDPEDIKKFSNL